jgi:hypothetical protein
MAMKRLLFYTMIQISTTSPPPKLSRFFVLFLKIQKTARKQEGGDVPKIRCKKKTIPGHTYIEVLQGRKGYKKKPGRIYHWNHLIYVIVLS